MALMDRLQPQKQIQDIGERISTKFKDFQKSQQPVQQPTMQQDNPIKREIESLRSNMPTFPTMQQPQQGDALQLSPTQGQAPMQSPRMPVAQRTPISQTKQPLLASTSNAGVFDPSTIDPNTIQNIQGAMQNLFPSKEVTQGTEQPSLNQEGVQGEPPPITQNLIDFASRIKESNKLTEGQLYDFVKLTNGALTVDQVKGKFKDMGYEVPGEEKGFGGRLGEYASRRGEKIKKSTGAYLQGNQTFVEGLTQSLGQVLGLGADVIGDTIMTVAGEIIPDFIKEGATEGAKNILSTETGQDALKFAMKGVNSYKERASENQRSARNVESVFNIADFAINFAGGSILKAGGKEAVKQGVNVAGKVASKIPLENVIKGFEKTAEKLGEIPSYTGKGIFKGIQGTKKAVTRDFPISRIEKDLGLTPTERARVENTGITPGQFMLEKNLGGLVKEQQVNKLHIMTDENYNGITTKLKSIPEDVRMQSPEAKKMLGTMVSEMEKSDIIKADMPEYIEKLKELQRQVDYSPLEGNQILRDFSRIVGQQIWDSKGRVSGAEDKILAGRRNKLSDTLVTEAKKYNIDIKAMNTDMRNAISIRDGLLRRLSQENKNNTFSLQDIGIGAILSAGEPISATAIVLGKKAIEKAVPGISQKLYNLNKEKYVPTNMRRGVNVPTRDTSRGFSITPDTPNRGTTAGIKALPAPKPTVIPEGGLPQVKNPMTASPRTYSVRETGQENIKIPGTTRGEKVPATTLSNPLERIGEMNKPKLVGKEVKLEKKVNKSEIKNPLEGIGKTSKKEGVKLPGKTTPKDIDPLVQEAKKYKTADEFVKKQGDLMYHGTNTQFNEFNSKNFGKGEGSNKLGEGVYLAKGENRASEYGKNVMKVYINKNVKTIDFDDIKYDPRYEKFFNKNKENYKNKYGDKYRSSKMKNNFAREYFDGIKYGGDETIIFDPKNIKTESQIKQIREQAKNPIEGIGKTKVVKKKEIAPLVEEAKKYKTADEFVKDIPMYYHGTNRSFEKFDFKKTGTITDPGLLGEGAYFSPYEAQGKQYAQDAVKAKGGQENIVKAHIVMKRPLVIENGKLPDGRDLMDLHNGGPITKETAKNATKEFKKMGYDGAVFKQDGNIAQVVSFDPNNIISETQLKQIREQANTNPVKTPKPLNTAKPTKQEVKVKGLPKGTVSKDEKGLTLYHGTNAQFDEFLESKTHSPNNLYGNGVYLSDTKSVAENYAMARQRLNKGDRNVIETTVNKDNKLVDLDQKIGDSIYSKLPEDLKDVATFGEELTVNKNHTIREVFDMTEPGYRNKITEILKSEGYDGVKFKDTSGQAKGKTSYIIFDPKNIKIIKNQLFSTFGPIVGGGLLLAMMGQEE